MPGIATRFRDLHPRTARAVLAALCVAIAALLALALPMTPPPEVPPGRHGDLGTYEMVVERLQAGEPYHEALHAELLAGGYGTLSIFNWRPPFFLSAVALAPSPLWAQAVLVALAAATLLFAAGLVRAEGSLTMMGLAAGALTVSLFAVLVPHAELACELAAGTLILLSAVAYGRGMTWLGFGAALLALFTREIAGVYVLVAIVLAVRAGRWREVGAWAVGLVAFAVYFGWHYASAMQLIGPADQAYPDGWLQFGGFGFVLRTATFNGLFVVLPYWLTALYLPLAVLGLLAWPGRAALRASLTVGAFLVLFALFGKPVNGYWGSLYTPLLALGVPWVPAALRDLWRAATAGRRAIAGAGS